MGLSIELESGVMQVWYGFRLTASDRFGLAASNGSRTRRMGDIGSRDRVTDTRRDSKFISILVSIFVFIIGPEAFTGQRPAGEHPEFEPVLCDVSRVASQRTTEKIETNRMVGRLMVEVVQDKSEA
jgi:hypothetical protein